MITTQTFPEISTVDKNLIQAYRQDETEVVEFLLNEAQLPPLALSRVRTQAEKLVSAVRHNRFNEGTLDSFMYEYDLSSEEGIILMCLAEALLRIPDSETVDKLIRDKLTSANWRAHLGQSDSLLVNAATWGLMLTGKVLSQDVAQQPNFKSAFKRLVSRSGEPVIRKAMAQAMKILSRQFVMGSTIENAIKRAKEFEERGYRYSYDMLGEAALTADDAKRYYDAYENAIHAIGKEAGDRGVFAASGISIKLSALHPRYEFSQHVRVLNELSPRVLELAKLAKSYNIGLTIDAEESERLELSLAIIKQVVLNPALDGWEGFGVAVQTYQKRAWYVLDALAEIARKRKQRFKLRLIKGAYWDTEIKNTQMEGLNDYPVFTRKASTDVSFIACAKKLLSMPDAFYPQFATHNAYSVAVILELVKPNTEFEFQCLHGMGQSLYDEIVGEKKLNIPCRIYAPVGNHQDLLPYLVRRLLENGANTSFVNRIADANAPMDVLLADPVAKVANKSQKPHSKIPLPRNLYGERRVNSQGLDLTHRSELTRLEEGLIKASEKSWIAKPTTQNVDSSEQPKPVLSPTDHDIQIGESQHADNACLDAALTQAYQAHRDWQRKPFGERAAILRKAGELIENHLYDFMYLAIHEAGKTFNDAVAEVREAVDFCNYYAEQAEFVVGLPKHMPGYTGETNTLQLAGRGIMVCISPWNFPLAIFTGQVAAALVTGNCVLAKPAEQTPLIAALATECFHEAGVPKDVLHLTPGRGSKIGAKLVADERVAGVMFTGSTETARRINQTLSNKEGPLGILIAETGGQNAMIVDSSALTEQVVQDVIQSSLGSAGQRCSALRVLYLQDDIADKTLLMLKGAMAELRVGYPSLLNTDIGPVIDEGAYNVLQEHADYLESIDAELLFKVPLQEGECKKGTFFAPRAYLISNIGQLPREVFGPILHVIRFAEGELDKVIAEINNTGYGLTLGIHSRIQETIDHIAKNIHVGNCYVNRNMIGAVVGVQPFGGQGLSGTGPKAGGPNYLPRLCHEHTLTVNTTAAGGNATLMAIGD